MRSTSAGCTWGWPSVSSLVQSYTSIHTPVPWRGPSVQAPPRGLDAVIALGISGRVVTVVGGAVVVGAALVLVVGGIVVVGGSVVVTSTVGRGRSTAATSREGASPRRAATTPRSAARTTTAVASTSLVPHPCARIAPPLWQ